MRIGLNKKTFGDHHYYVETCSQYVLHKKNHRIKKNKFLNTAIGKPTHVKHFFSKLVSGQRSYKHLNNVIYLKMYIPVRFW
jgi:hypothetical protein